MKKTIIILILALAACMGQAQRFEWAKGFTSDGGVIWGSVADRDDNLYIIGQFSTDARWNGQLLMPSIPSYTPRNTANALIAKISSQGDMLWKKVIHNTNGTHSRPYCIRMIGDTAVACMVEEYLPNNFNNYVYLLDTFLMDNPDDPTDESYFVGNTPTDLFFLFDLDGNVMEKHTLFISLLDADGNDSFQNDHLQCGQFKASSFSMDSSGNIYICRECRSESSTLHYGSKSAIKYWVDYRPVGIQHINPHMRPLKNSPQLVKFSPHFDTVLAARHIFYGDNEDGSDLDGTRIQLDKNRNLYLIGTHSCTADATLDIDPATGIFYHHPGAPMLSQKEILVKFDSLLHPLYCTSFDRDSVTNPGQYIGTLTSFYDIAIDNDSSLLFICGRTGRSNFTNPEPFSIPVYQGIPLEDIGSNAFVLVLRMEDASLVAHAHVPAIHKSEIQTASYLRCQDYLTCANNRIFLQANYYGGVRLPSGEVRFPVWGTGLGLFVFDYWGNLIDGYHYGFSPGNAYSCPGTSLLVDSILYLNNTLKDTATFGNLVVPAVGNQGYLAKLVDTAFMHPYPLPPRPVYPDPSQPDTSRHDPVAVPVADAQGPCTAYPNPTTGLLHLDTGGLPVVEASLSTLFGQRLPLRPSQDHTFDLSSLPDGIYLLQVTTPTSKVCIKVVKRG